MTMALLAGGSACALADEVASSEPGPPVTADPGCVASIEELPAWVRDDPRAKGEDLIVVLKDQRRLALFSDGQVQTLDDGRPACWRVGLASGYPAGHKQVQGDMKTPEGFYRTSDKPSSSFYGAIAVHYPDAADARKGEAAGRIDRATRESIEAASAKWQKPNQYTALGGEILIHGGGGDRDWTLGCVALDNGELDVLRDRLGEKKRTWVVILP